MLLSQMTDQIGRVLGDRYRLVAPIGTGSSAQVFLADDIRLRRRVAVKVLHPALADDQTFLRRFRAEAQASAKLSHPNIVTLLDSGNDDGPYLVTEFVGGGSLRAMLDQGHRLSVAQALVVGLEAARGLDFAHRQGFVHRDIKPANLLFGDDGRLRVADFGVARALAEAAWTEPSGAVLGTARYASPEQVQGQPVTGKGDVYSLALVLVEAVTGQVPFAADTTIGTLMARVDTPLGLGPEMGVLGGVLERAGRPDPDDRPDAAELAARFVRLGEELDAPEPLPLAGAFPVDELAPFVDPDPTWLPDDPSDAPPVVPAEADEPPPGPVVAEPPSFSRRLRSAFAARRTAGTAAAPAAAPPVVAANPGPAHVAAEAQAEAEAVPEPEPPAGGRSRRPMAVTVVAGLVALALVVAGGLALREALRPRHEVPQVQGLDVGDLPALVDGNGWSVERVSTRLDGTRSGEIVAQDPAPGSQLREGHTFRVTVSRGPELVTVPDGLDGLTAGEAEAALDAVGLRPGVVSEKWGELVPAGIVLGQSLIYDEVPSGARVPLVVSKGPRPRAVPEGMAGAGLGFDEVAARLQEVQLQAVRGEDYSDTVPEGSVIGTNPAGGSLVPRDSEVVVLVSLGPEPVIVPDVSGDTVASAQAALEDAGLLVDGVEGPPNGVVTGTDPAAGLQVDRDTSIVIITQRRGASSAN